MTPLAHRITNELMLPIKRRTFVDNCGLLGKIDDMHCFEVSQIFDAAADLAKKFVDRAEAARSAWENLLFLPAPKTWIEFGLNGRRFGVLLEQRNGFASAYWAAASEAGFVSFDSIGKLPLQGHAVTSSLDTQFWPSIFPAHSRSEAEARTWNWQIIALLAMINAPRIVGRRQHDPHRGLARKLLAGRGICGRFPLRAWTEIILEVTPPRDASSDEPSETRLTGQRALHFVRAHLGIRWGQLVLISACWRGDASLGIRQSRYLVVPPKSMEASA